MTPAVGARQVPSKDAVRVGNSGVPPENYSESRFVADEAPGVLDVEHPLTASGQVVTLSVDATRYVGTVDADGFLSDPRLHLDQGTLADRLLLTVRARISAVEVGGVLGQALTVEVVLNPGTSHARSLGTLDGRYGTGSDDWQEFVLEVDTTDVRFPADPCPGQTSGNSCGRDIEPVPNELAFVFTGINFPAAMEADWLMLEPLDAPGLAWRPVLLVHGLGTSGAKMAAGTAWFDGLGRRDVACHAPDFTPRGSIVGNGAEITLAVDDLKRRFGVERVHILAHSSGGIHAREHVRSHNDVETLITLGTPHAGSFVADCFAPLGRDVAGDIGEFIVDALGFPQMMSSAMAVYNQSYVRNRKTTFVCVAGDFNSTWALKFARRFGPNDGVVSVASAQALSYAVAWTYINSFDDVLSNTVCSRLTNHSCLRYYPQIVDDLFPDHIAVLTPPPELSPTAAEDPAVGAAGVMTAAGVVTAGVTSSHTAVVDVADAAIFLVLGDQNALRFELVSPSGIRIDPSAVDPAVTHDAYQDDGFVPHAGYHVESPETGIWLLEVIGTDAAAPDGAAYAVATTLLAGAVVLAVAADRDPHTAGETVTITATITEDGVPVTGATVGAIVGHPDGSTRTEFSLGSTVAGYTGGFTATDAGRYVVVVSAERAAPAFTREQVLFVSVAHGGAVFADPVSDHAADLDGDGLAEALVIEVPVDVAVAAAYRLFGTLTDGAGTIIEQLRAELDLLPGPTTVPLSFDGALLFALGRSGPYVLEDLVLEEVATAICLDRAEPYTTAAYHHTDFLRPPCLLTGGGDDHGVRADGTALVPYDTLVVEVEVDSVAGADVRASAKLYAGDGTFVAAASSVAELAPGPDLLEFRFGARDIFDSGMSGPYELRLLSVWGMAAGVPVSLRSAGVVAVTGPYAVADFAEPTRFTVGGTVTGLVGTGLVVSESVAFLDLSPGNGPFAFTLPMPAGTRYDVRVTKQPANPSQTCTVRNATGTIGGADVTDVVVECAPPRVQAGLDTGFGSGGTVTADRGGPSAMALQSDGKIVLVGGRTLSRFNQDGTPDLSFGVGGAATVVFSGSVVDQARGVAVQPDGRIVVAGHTSNDVALERHLADGSMDTDFGTGGTVRTDFSAGVDQAQAVLIQPDGLIVVAGHASTGPPVPANEFAVARYTATGALDPDFGAGGKVTTRIAGGSDLGKAALLQPDGGIVLAGRVAVSGGTNPDFGLVRYTTDGVPDPGFGVEGIVRTDFGLDDWVEPTDLARQSDGGLVVTGIVLAGAGPKPFAIARFDHTGAVDQGFGVAGLVTTPFDTRDAVARAVAVQADDKIVVAGYTGDGVRDVFTVARYTADGVLDPGFGTGGTLTVDYFGGSDRAECVVVQTDDEIVVAGSAINVRAGKLALARILP